MKKGIITDAGRRPAWPGNGVFFTAVSAWVLPAAEMEVAFGLAEGIQQ